MTLQPPAESVVQAIITQVIHPGPVVRGFGENGQMAFELPVVDAASLAIWCEVHLGSPVESELFRTGHLTRVIGTRLADGRAVVVRVRPAAPRLAACAEVTPSSSTPPDSQSPA